MPPNEVLKSRNSRPWVRRRRVEKSIFLGFYLAWLSTCILIRPAKAFVGSRAPRQSFLTVPVPTSSALFGIKGFRSWFESQFPDAILAMPKAVATDEFDHVLIDMNQLLHISLRRARSEGHALTLLMKELDACCDLASPKRSLVLAMDGPPSAAKLATQRRRRFSTIVRSEWKKQQLKRFGRSLSKSQEARKMRRYTTETKTLCITPGTAFMDRAEQALLYWTWQRMSNPRNRLSNVRVYISSSRVHGEGEVKLLDWILQKNRRGESIAIVGGDSDLVLEGLVIPPSSTHNLHVLLPDGNKRYLAVSLWETTRALAKFLPKLEAGDMMNVRTDLVLLLILNGNDYLPRLRGCSGFNKVFHTYLRLLHQWLDDKEAHPQAPFLVDPDSLDFNIPFCISFFRHLAQLTPPNFVRQTTESPSWKRVTALGQLNNLIESRFLPEPVRWKTVSPEDDAEGEDLLEEDDNIDEEDATEDVESDDIQKEQVLVRLSMGQIGADDYLSYDIWHDVGARMKDTKHQLARMALEDLTGEEFSDESDDDDELGYAGITGSGYAWEVQRVAPANVSSYLGGLLWNLQTYQDGVCADYAYNYGRRVAPSATSIVDFFKGAVHQHRTVGRDELLGEAFSHPVSAGLACLAALPSQVAQLVPQPYVSLPNTTVEELYAAAMNPADNVFDIKKFERLCDEQLDTLGNHGTSRGIDNETAEKARIGRHGRRILTSDHHWTVISRVQRPLAHPFDPPNPFSDRLSGLRPNRRMKVSRVLATAIPRPRSVWSKERNQSLTMDGAVKNGRSRRRVPPEVTHAKMGASIISEDGQPLAIKDVPCFSAYREFIPPRKKRRKVQFDLSLPKLKTENSHHYSTYKERLDFDVIARRDEFKVIGPPPDPVVNVEGQTALALLNQLEEANLVGPVHWNITTPSHSMYASVNPKLHELVQLTVSKVKGPGVDHVSEGLVYEQDRHISLESRQALKQHLASFVLCDLLGPRNRWSEMSFKDVKAHLTGKVQPKR